MHKLIKAFLNPSYACVLFLNQIAPYIKDDEKFVKIKYRLTMGRQLDLANPRTFDEKLQWLKIHNQRPEYSIMVDKYDAKKYVADIIGEEYIIPTLGIYNSFEEIDFEQLPQQFVLKCTHNSGGIVICKDKNNFKKAKAKKFLTKYLHKNPYWSNREYPYKTVKPRIIIEQYMVNGEDKELKDYKFYCFNKKAVFCQVIANRSSNETIDFYDRNWKHQDFIGLNAKAKFSDVIEEKPSNYNEMLSISDQLSELIDAPFVRIDLYNINNKIYFGEITFFPLSGLGFFRPNEWNYKIGNMLKLPIDC